MTFLTPYWLFAASAVLIPIAIHLWNKRQGKTVKVGSIRWLDASASKQLSRIRLTDIWLLLLRCLIFILLVVALAKPVISVAPGAEKGQKAIYVSPELLYSESISTLRSTVEPLLQRGYTLHAFTPMFPTISEEQWQQFISSPSDSLVGNGNYWELLPALAQKYQQPEDSIWLFTSDQQRHFAGRPAPLQENITWVPVALEQTNTWLQAAHATPADSIMFLIGKSNRDNTTYEQHYVQHKVGATQQVGNLPIKLVQRQENLYAYWSSDTTRKVPVKQKPIAISITADQKQHSEAKYLQAAFTAISQYTGVPITFQSAITKDTNWAFWLLDSDVPDSVKALVADGMQLWLQPGSDPALTVTKLALSEDNLQVYQLTALAPGFENVVWSAANGEPVLTAERSGKGIIYFFRSGFGPAWSSLGQSALLPDLLLPLIFTDRTTSMFDARALPDALLSPAKETVPPRKAPNDKTFSLVLFLILAALVLFLIERFTAAKRVKA